MDHRKDRDVSKRRLVSLSLVAWLSGAVLSAVCLGAQPKGHRFGEWPALSAMIHDRQQKHLNLGQADFLIEIWFKPLAPSKYGAGGTLVSKKCASRSPGYTLSYNGENLGFAVCDKGTENDRDIDIAANAGIKQNQWCYGAVSYSHSARKLVLYRDGKKIQERGSVELGDIINKDPFCVTYYENMGNSQAHCIAAELRVWKLAEGLPGNLDALVAGHQEKPGQLATALTDKAQYSRWVFGPGNDDIKDMGKNGNTL